MSVRQTSGRGRTYDSVLDTVGDTPVIRINRIAPDNVTVYVKAEAFNPLASVKDRLALNIIEAAERSGALKPGQTVVEATSGNTGIGLAMVCAAKGYPLVCIMADSFSVERRKLDVYYPAISLQFLDQTSGMSGQVGLGTTEREHESGCSSRRVDQRLTQESDRRLISPMEVIDDQDRGRLRQLVEQILIPAKLHGRIVGGTTRRMTQR